MRIVTDTPDVLRFEHRSWAMSLFGTALALVAAYGTMDAWADLMPHQRVFGVACSAATALCALLVSETSRVAFDRETGTVRMFRKRAFRTLRLELPLAEFQGALSEKVFFSRGLWYKRPALVFGDGEECWLIPATRGSTAWSVATVVARINGWHGVETSDIERASVTVYTPPSIGLAILADIIRKTLSGS